jgi:catechol 2,3-dioxygenase-like lactoylglutathione lyase family enzyme
MSARLDHVGLDVSDYAASKAFYEGALASLVAAGGRDNGAPGVREIYHPHYYGAFVLDPDGNNIEAVCHKPAP